MKTFIVLTFGFLAFAFYEMSGGSEFEPASVRYAQTAPEADQVEVTAARTATQTAPAEAPVQSASFTSEESEPSVTRVALNLTAVRDAQVPEAVTEAASEEVPQEEPQAVVFDSSLTPQIILPSLIATSSSPAAQSFSDDVRTVTGNRVNVRGGPSTSFGVVSKLTRGEQVRILEDSGDGWVLMEPVEGGESGWMADFLLTSG